MDDVGFVNENLHDFGVAEKASTSNTYTEKDATVCYLLIQFRGKVYVFRSISSQNICNE